MEQDEKKQSESSEENEKDTQEREENEPDVILDVPKINAEALKMEAENVSFSISVKAQLKNFTTIEIGTDIHIDKIKLDIDSLEAEAMFKVKLKKIESIFLKALEALDNNPQLIKNTQSLNKKSEGNGKDNKD